MNFKDYIEHKCININKLTDRVEITRRRLTHTSAPDNLTYREVERLKAFIGDWDKQEGEAN